MAIRRKVKIDDLGQFDSDWKDSFIVFYTLSKQQLLKFNKDSKEITTKLENEDNKKSLEDAELMFDLISNTLKGVFVKGEVFDADEGKKVEITAKNLDDFDLGVLKHFLQRIQGVEKKD